MELMKPVTKHNKKRILNIKKKTGLIIVMSLFFLVVVVLIGGSLNVDTIGINLTEKNLSPNKNYLFGTDWLGRDMFRRTLMGLSLSIKLGVLGAIGSTMIAVILGMTAATMGGRVDSFISWLIDLFLSIPHIVTLILISFSLGGGLKGVIVGLILTHWPNLARVLRAEVMQVRSSEYVQISKRMGKSNAWIAIHHIFPLVLPQAIIGFVLLFPHAILHETSLTFLGLGISSNQPAIGVILSESMKYLNSGMWWLDFFPGLSLLIVVLLFEVLGEKIQLFMNPVK